MRPLRAPALTVAVLAAVLERRPGLRPQSRRASL